MIIIFIVLVIIFLLLNILDGISTYQVIIRTNYNSERNPVARYIIKKAGTIKGILIIKSLIIVILPLIIYAWFLSRTEIFILMILMNILYFFVVYNNFKIVKRIDRR